MPPKRMYTVYLHGDPVDTTKTKAEAKAAEKFIIKNHKGVYGKVDYEFSNMIELEHGFSFFDLSIVFQQIRIVCLEVDGPVSEDFQSYLTAVCEKLERKTQFPNHRSTLAEFYFEPAYEDALIGLVFKSWSLQYADTGKIGIGGI